MISEADLLNIEISPLQFFHLSAMTVAEKTVLKNKLKADLAYVKSATENIKMGCKRKLSSSIKASIDAYSFSDSGRQQQSSSSENHQFSSSFKRKAGSSNVERPNKDQCVDTVNMIVTKKSKTGHDEMGSSKCENTGSFGHPKEKSLEMSASRYKQCSGVLKNLMAHRFGWVFNQPVDPVKLQIPDYFSIITKPMDLGTINHKLEGRCYSTVAEFADDIRLTFSNAMRYNPPKNDVHIMAKKLNDVFSSSWKPLEAKWRKEELSKLQTKIDKLASSSKQMVRKTPVNLPGSHSRNLLSTAQHGHIMNAHGQHVVPYLHKDEDSTRSFTMRNLARPAASQDVTCKTTSEGCQVDNGLTSISGDENAQPSPTLTSPSATSRKGDETYEEQLSPSKALRAAILKSRFADTIVKAQQKTLLNNGMKGDAEKMQQEKEKLEKKQRQERERIEAEIKAAEAALRKKEEAELRLQREKEREAARQALQKMERTVNFDENCEFLRNLQNGGYADIPSEMIVSFMDGMDHSPGCSGNLLEQLGLFRKNDDLDEEADDEWVSANVDIEEGEIGT